jgi:hypothetical protein
MLLFRSVAETKKGIESGAATFMKVAALLFLYVCMRGYSAASSAGTGITVLITN